MGVDSPSLKSPGKQYTITITGSPLTWRVDGEEDVVAVGDSE